MRSHNSEKRCVGQRGFSLIEAVVVIGVVALLAGVLMPGIFSLVTRQRTDATLVKLKEVNRVILGDGQAFMGFVGDIGRLPLTLQELLSNPNNLPAFAVNSTTGVASGWNGPYLAAATGENPLVDGWGVAFTYNTTTGQIASNGSDQVAGTTDDINLPASSAAPLSSAVLLTVFVNGIPNPTGLTVTTFAPSNGTQGAQAPIAGVPGFAYALIQGMHAVMATHTGTTSSGATVTVTKTMPFLVTGARQMKVRLDMTTPAIVTSQ